MSSYKQANTWNHRNALTLSFLKLVMNPDFQAKEGIGNRASLDIERLYLLFDVALRNNLASLICHCILFSFN